MKEETKEISLRDLLDTEFTINDKMEMVGTFTLERINMISDILTNLQEEKEDYKQRNEKAVEILKLCNSKCAKETISILKGDKDE